LQSPITTSLQDFFAKLDYVVARLIRAGHVSYATDLLEYCVESDLVKDGSLVSFFTALHEINRYDLIVEKATKWITNGRPGVAFIRIIIS